MLRIVLLPFGQYYVSIIIAVKALHTRRSMPLPSLWRGYLILFFSSSLWCIHVFALPVFNLPEPEGSVRFFLYYRLLSFVSSMTRKSFFAFIDMYLVSLLNFSGETIYLW